MSTSRPWPLFGVPSTPFDSFRTTDHAVFEIDVFPAERECFAEAHCGTS
jgi:hypothetical protein